MALGQIFRLAGNCGVLTFTIDWEHQGDNGMIMIAGTVSEGVEQYVSPEGRYRGSRDLAGTSVSAWVTRENLRRGTNEPLRVSGAGAHLN